MRTIFVVALLFPAVCFSAEKYAWQWYKDKQFYNSYKTILTGMKVDNWVYSLKGPSGKSKIVNIENKKWNLIASCKAHDCANNNISILYNEKTKEIFALINSSNTIFVGNPPQLLKEFLLKEHESKYKYSNIKERLKNTNGM